MGSSRAERRRVQQEQAARYGQARYAEKPGTQLALGIDLGRGRCQICGRAVRNRCKWCSKNGCGDPPCPEMKAWDIWVRGLRKTTRRALERAGLDEVAIERTLSALFEACGEVPEEVVVHVQHLMPEYRTVSSEVYEDERGWAYVWQRIWEQLYAIYCKPIDPFYDDFLEKIERHRRMSLPEIVAEDKARQQALGKARRRVHDISDLTVEMIKQARAAGISKEQRTGADFLALAMRLVDSFSNISEGRWGYLTVRFHARQVVRAELDRITNAVPVDDEFLEQAMRSHYAHLSVDAVFPELWDRLRPEVMELVSADASAPSPPGQDVGTR